MYKTIYHGSDHIIRKPVFGSGRAYNDFGLGFYCTESPTHAAEWAVKKDGNGFVSCYSLDCDGLRIIDLCSPQYTPLHWINLILNFREFDPTSPLMHRAKEYITKEFPLEYQGSDCIIGYRADNICFSLTQSFLEGRITYTTFKELISDDSMGRQFVLKSNRAMERVLYTGYSAAYSSEHYPVRASRELKYLKHAAIDEQRELLSAAARIKGGDLYIDQLIDEEVKAYDARLR